MFARLSVVRTKYCPMSRSWIYAEEAHGTFPGRVKLGRHASAWVIEELEAWASARAAGCSREQLRVLVSRMVASRSPDRTSADVRDLATRVIQHRTCALDARAPTNEGVAHI
jgi:predicted DNA-binding transcriptional regulator AlpA